MDSTYQRSPVLAKLRRFLPRAALDAVIIMTSYMTVYLIIPERIFRQPWENTWFVIGATVTLIVSMYYFKVYQRIWARTSGHGIITIINAVTIPTVILGFFVALINARPLSLATVLFGNLIALVGFVGVRYRSRIISGLARRWRYVFSQKPADTRTVTLIVGAGESGQTLAMRLNHSLPQPRYRIIGFIDDDRNKHQMFVEGLPVLGGREEIPAIAAHYEVELIVVAIHNISGPDIREILNLCEETNAQIKVMPDVLDLMNPSKRSAVLRDVKVEDLLGRGAIERHESVELEKIMHKRILITGAAGSIGSELSRQVLSYAPEHVVLLDNNESGLYDLMIELNTINKTKIKITPVLADITRAADVQHVFDHHQPQIVFHAAAYKHVPLLESHPSEALRVNIIGTRTVAEIACNARIERFVLISTDKAVNPSSVMGATKRICELMLHAIFHRDDCQTLFTSVRFGNVLGSRGSVVPTFNSQIDRGGPVTVTDPEMTRYFMTIPEAVNLIFHAAALTKGDDIFILQMGEVVRILDLAERLIRLRGLRPNVDIAIVFTGIRPGEKMHEELYTEAENPESTLHPSIIKLNTWRDDFVGDEFWRKLNELLGNTMLTQANALAHLQVVINSQNAVRQPLAQHVG